MNVLQVGDNDVIGSRFNGHDLNVELRNRGHNAGHLVWKKHSSDPYTREIFENHPQRDTIHCLVASLEDVYGLKALVSPFSMELLFDPAFQNADVVHYHLLHNSSLNLLHLPILSRLKPTVWTLHDPWALTGHCIHPFECKKWKDGCRECPDLEIPIKIPRDITALNWDIKKQIYSQCDLDLVVASRWMEQHVQASPLLRHVPLHRIPFGVDLDVFRPSDRTEARETLGIPTENIVLGFRATPGEFKGLATIRQMLRDIQADRPISLLTLQHTNLVNEFRNKFHVVDLGWIFKDKELARVFNACDLFLMPSRAESFGMMAMEAMACGTVCVAMAGTALEETLFPEKNGGVIVEQGDQPAFCRAVENLIANDQRRMEMGGHARALAMTHYDQDRYVSDILTVYTSAIQRHSRDGAGDKTLHRSQSQSIRYPVHPEITLPPETIFLSYWLRLYSRLQRSRLIKFIYRYLAKPILHKHWRRRRKARK